MLPVWLTDTVTPDLNRALHYTQLWGLRGVELRTVGGAEDRVPEVNERQIREQLEKTDFLLAGVNPSVFEGPVSDKVAWMNDLARLDESLRFCQRVGSPRVVVSAFAAEPRSPLDAMAEAFRRAGDKAAEHDVLIAARNGPETACPTGASLAELLEAVDHPNVKAAWSPAGAFRAGEDPAEGLDALEGRVTLVRCGDGEISTDGYWADTTFGTGAIDWEHQLEVLARRDYLGPLSLEIYVEPRPKHGLRSATNLIHMVRDARAKKKA
jgi:sugar phosphate isomerase/epimerase